MQNLLKEIGSWLTVLIIALLGTAILIRIYWLGVKEKAWLDIAKAQFPTVVGLPLAAGLSMFVVLILNIVVGQIKVTMPGFSFEGAAGPIVFWVICFLAITGSIKMLWQSPNNSSKEDDPK